MDEVKWGGEGVEVGFGGVGGKWEMWLSLLFESFKNRIIIFKNEICIYI